MNHTDLGSWGENFVANLLSTQGWIPSIGQGENDILAIAPDGQTFTIEVKTAQKNKDRRWKFCLSKPKHTSHKTSDLVFLVAVTDCDPVVFCIPTCDILDSTQITITSQPESYTGRYAQYKL